MVEAYRIDGGDAAGFGGGGSDMAGVSDVQRCSGGKPLTEAVEEIQSSISVYVSFAAAGYVSGCRCSGGRSHRFWKHHGFDIIAIGRAVKNNVVGGEPAEAAAHHNTAVG